MAAITSIAFGPVARGMGVAAITQKHAARVAALMYGTGSMLVATSLLLPHDAGLKVPVIGTVVAIAAATSGAFAVAGARLPAYRFFLATLGGTVLISVIVAFGGNDSTAFAMLYVWAAIYASTSSNSATRSSPPAGSWSPPPLPSWSAASSHTSPASVPPGCWPSGPRVLPGSSSRTSCGVC